MPKLIVANWKMNGTLSEASTRAAAIAAGRAAAKVVICPPFPHISAVSAALKDSMVSLGAQDCSPEEKGAFTGDTSAVMLAEMGCQWVLVGHSERRQGKGETNAQIKAKAEAAIKAGITPIICVGELLADRESKTYAEVIKTQVLESIPTDSSNYVIAYEPVWAIGTGLTASAADVAEVHALIKATLPKQGIDVIYGGSVKPNNAPELLAQKDIDGLLVGGASLVPADFVAIAKSAP